MANFDKDNDIKSRPEDYSKEWSDIVKERKNERRNKILFYVAIATLVATIIGWFV